jgi:hypothetical protein
MFFAWGVYGGLLLDGGVFVAGDEGEDVGGD